MNPSDKQFLQNILTGIGIVAVGHAIVFAVSLNMTATIPFWVSLAVDGGMAILVVITGIFGAK